MATSYSIFQVMPTLYSQASNDFGHLGCFQSLCLRSNVAVNITGCSSSHTCVIGMTFRSGVTGTERQRACAILRPWCLLLSKFKSLTEVIYIALEAMCAGIKSLWFQLDHSVSTHTDTHVHMHTHVHTHIGKLYHSSDSPFPSV